MKVCTYRCCLTISAIYQTLAVTTSSVRW